MGLGLQLSVHFLILKNLSQASVDFFIQNFILLEELQMVTFVCVSLEDKSIVLTFSLSHDILGCFQFFCEVFILVVHTLQVIAYIPILILGFHALLLKYFGSGFQTLDLCLKLNQFTILFFHYVFPSFHLLNKLG